MLIQRADISFAQAETVLCELRKFVGTALFPAPVCSDDCGLYQKNACHKNCNSAPDFLTSERGYPIERKVTPLVFELKRLRVFEPCWSCEGHLDSEQKLWKLPSVWFYAINFIYIRLLTQVLESLFVDHLIKARWVVKVIPSHDQNPATCFALRPEGNVEMLDLLFLQNDIKTISEHLVTRMMREANRLLNTIQ